MMGIGVIGFFIILCLVEFRVFEYCFFIMLIYYVSIGKKVVVVYVVIIVIDVLFIVSGIEVYFIVSYYNSRIGGIDYFIFLISWVLGIVFDNWVVKCCGSSN